MDAIEPGAFGKGTVRVRTAASDPRTMLIIVPLFFCRPALRAFCGSFPAGLRTFSGIRARIRFGAKGRAIDDDDDMAQLIS